MLMLDGITHVNQDKLFSMNQLYRNSANIIMLLKDVLVFFAIFKYTFIKQGSLLRPSMSKTNLFPVVQSQVAMTKCLGCWCLLLYVIKDY